MGFIVAVEIAPLLLTVQRVVGGVDVEHDLLRLRAAACCRS